MTDDSEEIRFQSFLWETAVSSSGMERDECPLFDVVHPLPTTASSTFKGALKNGFGEAVVARDMPEPCEFPFLDSSQKRFLWTHKEVDFAPHQVVGLVLQVGDAEKFPQAVGHESLDPFSQNQQVGSTSHSHRGG